MKTTKKFKNYFKLSAFICLVLVSSISCTSNEDMNDLTSEEIVNLAEKAYKDPLYEKITQYDVKRLISEISTTEENRKLRAERFAELSKKHKFSDEDLEFVSIELGFDSSRDHAEYFKLFTKFIKKYNLDKLSLTNYQYFFDILKLNFIKDYMSDEVSIKKITKSASNHPECMKCAYDYMECMAGSTSLLTYSYGYQLWHVIIDGGAGWNYDLWTRTMTNAWTSTYTEQECWDWYNSCLNGCQF